MPFVLVWTGENAENEGFRKHWRHELDNQSPTENENASVDADICIRLRWIKNAEAYENGLVWT